MAGRSPPRHRHDGTSPLPLGIDASPAPSRWNGAQTEWPHDPRTGWSYCVFIPSWVVLPEVKDSGGKFINPTVFFRVQVGIQSPDAISTLRTTLRRFSDFLKLFAAVKKLFPKKKLPAAPPKNSLMRMNSSHSLLQERRHALEDWMGMLLADIDISRSVPVASFLELEAAVRTAVISVSEGQSQLIDAVIAGVPVTNSAQLHQAPSLRPGLSWTGGGSSVASGVYSNLEYGSDVPYNKSVVGTPGKGSERGLEIEMEAVVVEERPAIIAAAANPGENLQQNSSSLPEITRIDNEAGLESQAQAEFPEDHAPGKQTSEMQPHGDQGQAVETENWDGLSGASFEQSGLRGAFSMGVAKLEPRHRRRTSQDSIVSEMSSAQGSELSRFGSVDVPLENTLLGFPSGESGGEGGSLMGTGAESLKGVGLILPADQRSKVRRAMVAMQRRLSVVKTDMEDLLARLNQETAVKEFLTTKVRDLEGELDGMRRKSREVLQQAVLLERERVTSLQWELEECRVALQSAEETAQSQQGEKVQLEESLQDAVTKFEKVEEELVDIRQQLQSVRRERDAVDAQGRADKKVMAKEIRSLRAWQMELKQEAMQAIQAKVAMEARLQEEKRKREKESVSQAKFLHELAMLRQRLQECSVDVLAREVDKLANKESSAEMTDAFDLVSTSDNRIGLLLAEAQLLAQEDEEVEKVQSSGNWSSLDQHLRSNGNSGRTPHSSDNSMAPEQGNEVSMRKILIDAFIEQAQLRKAMNSLTRGALMSGRQWDRNSRSEETVSRKSLLDHIL